MKVHIPSTSTISFTQTLHKKANKMKKKKLKHPRVVWEKNPVQKPHSTKKGKRGYDRKFKKHEYCENHEL